MLGNFKKVKNHSQNIKAMFVSCINFSYISSYCDTGFSSYTSPTSRKKIGILWLPVKYTCDNDCAQCNWRFMTFANVQNDPSLSVIRDCKSINVVQSRIVSVSCSFWRWKYFSMKRFVNIMLDLSTSWRSCMTSVKCTIKHCYVCFSVL